MAAEKNSAVQAAADVIRERIRTGAWSPGHRLVEGELTEEFGVSRGPLREAFGRLSAEGLVTIEPHRGAMVRKMTRADLASVYEVREVLEGLCARLTAELVLTDDAARRRIEGERAALAKLGTAPDPRAFMDRNQSFHAAIVELSANALAQEILGRLSTQIYRYSMRNLFDGKSMEQSHRQHLAVADAMLAGDGAKAERLMRQHVRASGVEALKVAEG